MQYNEIRCQQHPKYLYAYLFPKQSPPPLPYLPAFSRDLPPSLFFSPRRIISDLSKYKFKQGRQMSENPSMVAGGRPRRNKRHSYAKISLKTKLIFFQRVIREGASTRQVAKALGIKYSTAKTLVRKYSAEFEQEDSDVVQMVCMEFNRKGSGQQRCGYRSMDDKVTLTTGERSCDSASPETLFYGSQIEIISSIFPGRKSQ